MRKLYPSIDVDSAESKSPEPMKMLPLLMGERQAADYVGVSLSYLRKSRSEGCPGNRTQSPNFVKINGRVFYRRTDLDTWVAGLQPRRIV